MIPKLRCRRKSKIELLRRELVHQDSQFIIATHSPILLAYPNARILALDGLGFRATPYEETDPYQIMRAFLENPAEGVKKAFAQTLHAS
jgi:predicted ATPase